MAVRRSRLLVGRLLDSRTPPVLPGNRTPALRRRLPTSPDPCSSSTALRSPHNPVRPGQFSVRSAVCSPINPASWSHTSVPAFPADVDKFAAAHAAFGGDGVALVVPRGVAIERPFFVDVQAATSGAVSFPHLSLAAEESSQASVVVRYRSDDDVDALVIPQLEISVGTNANLKVTVIQHWGRKVRAISHARVSLGRDGSLHLGEAGLGGSISRLLLDVGFEGDGSSANIVGAYFGDERSDSRLPVHHAP